MAESGTVYLLHFDPPYHARHYLGFTDRDVEDRLREHLCGQGARLVAVVVGAGVSVVIARTWTGDRKLERALKRHGGQTRNCPICTPGTTRGSRIST